MNEIKSFADLFDAFKAMPVKKRVAVVCPSDEHTRMVVERCLEEKYAEIIAVVAADASADIEWAGKLRSRFTSMTVSVADCGIDGACRESVRLVREGMADVIMKGLVNTDNLLRAVLDKTCGLLPVGRVLSHVTATQIPGYPKLLLFSDAAVIPYPELKQFEAMIGYDVSLCRRFGVKRPRVALIYFNEKVNPKFPCTEEYARLCRLALDGAFGDAAVCGPMDVKTACDEHSAEIKHVLSEVTGKADILIFPDLTAANTFYKTITCFCHADTAGLVTGTIAPVVVPSRADTAESKFYSLALACVASL